MSDEADGPTQVLIAGAGPVGLTTAYELHRRGVRVRLVDAADGPATTSRAVATHARSMEVYDQMGLAPALLARGRRMQAFSMHKGGTRLARMGADYSALPTRYPQTTLLEQAGTEEVLRDALAARGVKVEWGVRLGTFTQDDRSVTATLHHAGGDEETVEVPWLVGCDGGRSHVRKSLGLRLVGDSTETWLIADAVIDMDVPDDSIHWLHVEGGTIMAVPFPETGKWRLLDTVDVDYDGDPAEVAARFSRKLAKGFGVRAVVHEPSWVSVFTIQQRMIERMRVGRCFVAGDAAHVHSPASGQGMNTGVQDAFNLAWKLAMVVRGQADQELLDSYAVERVPVGRTLLGATKKATALVALKGALQEVMLPVAFAVVRNAPPLKGRIERKIMAAMSGLKLSYPQSPLTTTDPGGHLPRPGERVTRMTEEDARRSPGCAALVEALRDPRWTLLVFPSPSGAAGAPDAAETVRGADWLSVRVATADLPDPDGGLRNALGVGREGWLLVRPDGYVAARGDRVTPDALRAATSFGWRVTTPRPEGHGPA
ncbi:NADPH-dependent dioxygenase [Streptomyces griseochromogenes]|uniref:Oxygenase n=1 Tax=Streptomyces griseochromogenes TaxID=68214 RepID=A0A1B1BB08_9ACTN|nr:FAD-dependent oxidoreductase [Streptomyces griseochromogenes]ANP56024.1 oxygenase [Streptomyces griseochromogenes]MBP2051125.1 NADPH-dependent dioxygenase [Streptomyces griseochromogenes]